MLFLEFYSHVRMMQKYFIYENTSLTHTLFIAVEIPMINSYFFLSLIIFKPVYSLSIHVLASVHEANLLTLAH